MRDMKTLFAAIADQYDRMNHVMSLALDRRWRRMALALVTLREPVLDLACGTGDFAAEVLRQHPDADVTGLDITPEMIAIARTKLTGNRITFRTGDAQDLSCFPDGHFGLIVCAFGFRNFPDKAKALAECRRVLSADGELLVLELFRPRSRLLGRLVHIWLAVSAYLFAHGARREYAYLRASVEATVSAAEFQSLAEAAGFSLDRQRFLFPAATCMAFRKATSNMI